MRPHHQSVFVSRSETSHITDNFAHTHWIERFVGVIIFLEDCFLNHFLVFGDFQELRIALFAAMINHDVVAAKVDISCCNHHLLHIHIIETTQSICRYHIHKDCVFGNLRFNIRFFLITAYKSQGDEASYK